MARYAMIKGSDDNIMDYQPLEADTYPEAVEEALELAGWRLVEMDEQEESEELEFLEQYRKLCREYSMTLAPINSDDVPTQPCLHDSLGIIALSRNELDRYVDRIQTQGEPR